MPERDIGLKKKDRESVRPDFLSGGARVSPRASP